MQSKIYAQEIMLTMTIFNSLEGQIKIHDNCILHRPSMKIHFLVEFQVISSIFLFIS